MLFQFEDVTKTYGAVTALDNSVAGRARGRRRPARAQRLRQDDDDPHAARAHPHRQGLGRGPRHGLSPAAARHSPGRRLRARGRVPVSRTPWASSSSPTPASWRAWRATDALQRAHEVLDYVGLGEARYRKVESYSTGMKQRLKLASAIVHDPKLLILDEPTNGMDPAGRQEILELARDLAHNKGMSLLFSSHLLPDVEAVCDYVIVLASGKLLGPGPDSGSQASAPPVVRGAREGRPRRRSRAARRAGLHDRAARRSAARAAARRPVAAAAVASGRRRRASRSAICGRSAARWKKCSSTRWSKRNAHSRSRISALVGHAFRPSRGAGWRSRGMDCGSRSPIAGCGWCCWSSWIPALALAAMLCLWGLLEQQSELIESVAPLLGFLDPEDARRPARPSHGSVDAELHLFHARRTAAARCC